MPDKEDIITIIGFLGLGFLFLIGMCWISSIFGVPFIIIW